MNRPTRQRNHLLTKVALKTSRIAAQKRKNGKRTKRWQKSIEAYKPVAA